MSETRKGIPPISGCLMGLMTLAALTWACASPSGPDLTSRQKQVEARIAEAGLEDDPRVEAARSRLEAALEREHDRVLLDSVELRAAAVNEEETKMDALVRVPIGNALSLSAEREARRAGSRVALAELSEAMIKSRANLCMPSLEYEARIEARKIFSEYAKQNRSLLKWNEELRQSGSVNEMDWSVFKLSNRIRLENRSVPETDVPLAVFGLEQPFGVLPTIDHDGSLLDSSFGVLREKVLVYQPEVEVHKAKEERYQAMAKGEAMKRLPSIRFVDFGFEPVPYPGQEREYSARVAFEIPFGREAGARKKRYEALARAEVNGQRMVLDDQVKTAKVAIDEVNVFRAKAQDWKDLLQLADATEKVAADWWRNRRAKPEEIAKLLDTVYSARVTVLQARKRAGNAVCTLLSATGIFITDW
ncbi:MAG: hypothetical protein HOI15_00445 [Opitutales bacterium]|nr:hypothetical protein [Opitutales bacterium]